MRVFTFTADKSFEGKPASAVLRHLGCSSDIIKQLKRGGLLINGSTAPTVESVKEGDKFKIIFPDEKPTAVPRLIDNVELIYGDEDIAVVNKPPLLPIHQSIGHYTDTLANHFAYLYPNCSYRAVTRLDKNTSGLCVIALNKLSAAIMCGNRPQKLYIAAVEGSTDNEGTVNAPIARESDSVIKRTVTPNGQRAVTHYKAIGRFNGGTLLELSLETGRTHQIRVHMAHIGHPLLGDEMYGGSTDRINRQALHCSYIKLFHPVKREFMEFKCELPLDMKIFEE